MIRRVSSKNVVVDAELSFTDEKIARRGVGFDSMGGLGRLFSRVPGPVEMRHRHFAAARRFRVKS
jgi:hypothetical protein